MHPAGWFFAVPAALGGGLVLRVTAAGAEASQDGIWSSRSRTRRGLVMYLPCRTSATSGDAPNRPASASGQPGAVSFSAGASISAA